MAFLQRNKKCPLDNEDIFLYFAQLLEKELSSLTTHDLANLCALNCTFNSRFREKVLSKIKKSFTINSNEDMQEFIKKCGEIGPDIVRSLTFGPFASSVLLTELCPTISSHIEEIIYENPDIWIEMMFNMLEQYFPKLNTLQLKLDQENIRMDTMFPPLIQVKTIESFKLQLNLSNGFFRTWLIPFLKGLVGSLPNLKHLTIIECDRRKPFTNGGFEQETILDLILDKSFNILGYQNLVSFHHESLRPTLIGNRVKLLQLLELKNCLELNNLNLHISYIEPEVDEPFVYNWFNEFSSNITQLSLLYGTEQLIPGFPFGQNLKELKLQLFVGSINFIRNLNKLVRVELIQIDMNSQLFIDGNEETDDKAIVEQVFGKTSHPNLLMIFMGSCAGGDKLAQFLQSSGIEVENEP